MSDSDLSSLTELQELQSPTFGTATFTSLSVTETLSPGSRALPAPPRSLTPTTRPDRTSTPDVDNTRGERSPNDDSDLGVTFSQLNAEIGSAIKTWTTPQSSRFESESTLQGLIREGSAMETMQRPRSVHQAPRSPVGLRIGQKVAYWEQRLRVTSPLENAHSRSASEPSGPSTRSISIMPSQSLSTFTSLTRTTPSTSTSRLTSPTKASASVSDTISGSPTVSQSYMNTLTDTLTRTYTMTDSNTVTQSEIGAEFILHRPRTSPRSPLSAVRNIMQRWREQTPAMSKSEKSPVSISPHSTGIGRSSDEKHLRSAVSEVPRVHASPNPDGRQQATSLISMDSGVLNHNSSLAFDAHVTAIAERVGEISKPLRASILWYLNVHASPPYRWQRCYAALYPRMLVLTWIAPGGGRGFATLDLLTCIDVQSTHSPSDPRAADDYGTRAAEEQSDGNVDLVLLLCPFHLLYSDGIERLAAESPIERATWVDAIWDILNRSVSIPDRSNTGSPVGSVRTVNTMNSQLSRSDTGSGSTSLQYVHLHDIPDISDIYSSVRSRASVPSDTHVTTSEDLFFSATSRAGSTLTPPSTYYSSSSFTRNLLSTLETTTASRTGLNTDETIAIGSDTGTHIVPSTLSLRRTESASMLGDSHFGTTPRRSISPSSSGTSLTRSDGIRRRSGYASSRSYSSGYLDSTEGSSDKENSDLYSNSRSSSNGPYSLSTLESYSYTVSGSESPTLPDLSTPQETTETQSYHMEEPVAIVSPQMRVESPTSSSVSLPTIPSLSEGNTADVYSTEYETAEVCPTEPSASEYETVEPCPTEPCSEYVTAEVCPTDASTEYETAECICPELSPVPFSSPVRTPRTSQTLSYLSYISPREPSPAQLSSPERVTTPALPREGSPPEPSSIGSSLPDITISSPATSRSPTRSPSELPDRTPTIQVVSDESLPEPSPIASPLPDFSVSSPVSSISPSQSSESSVSPSSSEVSVPSIPSILELPPVPTPSVGETPLWTESEESYDTSVLRPSPSIQSLDIHHAPDFSFETSHLRPSPSIESESDISNMTPIPERFPHLDSRSVSSVSMSVTASPPSPPPPIQAASFHTSTPSSISTLSSSIPIVSPIPSAIIRDLPLEDIATEPSLLPTEEGSPIPAAPRDISPPSTPLPPTPSISVSVSTPRGDIPSIHTMLDTVPSEPSVPAPDQSTLAHDIDLLLRYLQDLEATRGPQINDILNNLRALKDDVNQLMGDREPPDIPPVPSKDRVVEDQRRSPSVPSYTDRPQRDRRLVPMPTTPPDMRSPLPSPETLSDTMSFLSSHYSDDFSFMEASPYPYHPPSPSVSPPSSPPSSSPPSSSPGIPSRRLGIIPTDITYASPESVSPVERAARFDITPLQQLLRNIQEQLPALWEGQQSTNRMLDDLSRRGRHPDIGLQNRLSSLENALQHILDVLPRQIPRPGPSIPLPEEAELSSESAAEAPSIINDLREMARRAAAEEEPFQVPRHHEPPRLNLDDLLAQTLGSQRPLSPPTVRPPPPLITMEHGPLPARYPSVSSTFDLPDRAQTVPITGRPFVRDPRGPRVAHPRRRAPSLGDSMSQPEFPVRSTLRPGVPVSTYPAPVPEAQHVRDAATHRPRPSTAPPAVALDTSRPRPATATATSVPIPGEPGVSASGPQPPPPPPPAPILLELPSTFDQLLALLRENRLAQDATTDQRNNIIEHLRRVHDWINQDVGARQADIRNVNERIDEMTRRIARFRQPLERPSSPMILQAGQAQPTVIVPPSAGTSQPFTGVPVIPGVRPPGPEHSPPFIPPYPTSGTGPVRPIYMPPGPQGLRPATRYFVRPGQMGPEPIFVPPRLSESSESTPYTSGSSSSSPRSQRPAGAPIIIPAPGPAYPPGAMPTVLQMQPSRSSASSPSQVESDAGHHSRRPSPQPSPHFVTPHSEAGIAPTSSAVQPAAPAPSTMVVPGPGVQQPSGVTPAFPGPSIVIRPPSVRITPSGHPISTGRQSPRATHPISDRLPSGPHDRPSDRYPDDRRSRHRSRTPSQQPQIILQMPSDDSRRTHHEPPQQVLVQPPQLPYGPAPPGGIIVPPPFPGQPQGTQPAVIQVPSASDQHPTQVIQIPPSSPRHASPSIIQIPSQPSYYAQGPRDRRPTVLQTGRSPPRSRRPSPPAPVPPPRVITVPSDPRRRRFLRKPYHEPYRSRSYSPTRRGRHFPILRSRGSRSLSDPSDRRSPRPQRRVPPARPTHVRPGDQPESLAPTLVGPPTFSGRRTDRLSPRSPHPEFIEGEIPSPRSPRIERVPTPSRSIPRSRPRSHSPSPVMLRADPHRTPTVISLGHPSDRAASSERRPFGQVPSREYTEGEVPVHEVPASRPLSPASERRPGIQPSGISPSGRAYAVPTTPRADYPQSYTQYEPGTDAPVSPPSPPIPVPPPAAELRAVHPVEEFAIPPSQAPVPVLHPAPEGPEAITVLPPQQPSAYDLDYADAERDRDERFTDMERRFEQTLDMVEEGERRRDVIFQQNEDERERIFMDHEGQRDEESRLRREDSVRRVEERLADLPPLPETGETFRPPSPTVSAAPPVAPDTVAAEIPPPPRAPTVHAVPSVAPSVASAAAEAAARYSQEIRDVLQDEREHTARLLEAEREEGARRDAEYAEERRRKDEEYQAQVRELEAQLAALQADKDEAQAREMDRAQRHEDERQEARDRGEQFSAELEDISNALLDHKAECARKREVQEERYEDKERRRAEKEAQWREMQEQLRQLLQEKEECRVRIDKQARDLESAMQGMHDLTRNALAEWKTEFADTLRNMSTDCHQRLEDRTTQILAAARDASDRQVPGNVEHYLQNFSRSLATEIRLLIQELGKLHEKKRTLQYQIGKLLCFQNKFAPGGLMDDEWTPETWGQIPPDPTAPAEPAPEPEGPPPQVPPGWRTVPRWRNRLRRNGRGGPVAPPPPPPAPPVPAPPSPPPVPHVGIPERAPQGPRLLRRHPQVPHLRPGPDIPAPRHGESWPPALWPGPPGDYVESSRSQSIEATIPSPPRSPGLFGPPSE